MKHLALLSASKPAPELHIALATEPGRSRLAAHRGVSAQRRENTPEAFERAIELGLPMLELDVRRTRDGVLVVHHDLRIRGRRLRSMTHGQLMAWPPSRHIPTLEEVLELTRGRIRLDVELKEPGYEAQVLALVRARFETAEFVMTSFRDQIVRRVKQLAPDVCAGLLLGDYYLRQRYLLRRLSDLAPRRRLRNCQADFAACSRQLADWGMIDRLAAAGYGVVIWTVDDDRRLEQWLADERVHMVISNIPPSVERHVR